MFKTYGSKDTELFVSPMNIVSRTQLKKTLGENAIPFRKHTIDHGMLIYKK